MFFGSFHSKLWLRIAHIRLSKVSSLSQSAFDNSDYSAPYITNERTMNVADLGLWFFELPPLRCGMRDLSNYTKIDELLHNFKIKYADGLAKTSM